MRDGETDLFGHMDGGQQGPLLVTGRAGAALFTRVGYKHLVLAVWAAHSSKALLQIAAFEKGRHRALDDRAPVAVFGLKTFVVDLLEGLKMLVDQAPQVRVLRIAWSV